LNVEVLNVNRRVIYFSTSTAYILKEYLYWKIGCINSKFSAKEAIFFRASENIIILKLQHLVTFLILLSKFAV